MLSIAYCDDDDLQREILGDIIDRYIEARQLNTQAVPFASSEKVLQAVRDGSHFDVYILDIIMEGMNGFELASELRQLNDEGIIIFLTSTVDYAVQAFDVRATYYMVKPVNPQKLYSIFDRFMEARQQESGVEIMIKADRGSELIVRSGDVLYVTCSYRRLTYYLRNGKVIEGRTLRTSFKEAVGVLLNTGRFCMCGVSMLINLDEILEIDSASITFKNGDSVFPPSSSTAEIRNVWKTYKSCQ